FGLCNAGETFQRLVDIVLAGVSYEICLAYLDDVVLFSRTIADHFDRLKVVLDRLQGAGLKLKPSKCFMLQKSVTFLGHLVSGDGVSVHSDKVSAVDGWPTPMCVRDVRGWLGLTGYYRRFVQNYAKVAAPLTALLSPKVKWVWTDREQSAFDTLKAALVNPPILAMPAAEGLFTLDTDASKTAAGAVLSQNQDGVERVIAYASKTLSRTQRNYCVTRRELLAIIHFLRYFRHYLLGVRFRIRTDHAALLLLRRIPEPVGQQARWLEMMEEFVFFVEHRPGRFHSNADALSRVPLHSATVANDCETGVKTNVVNNSDVCDDETTDDEVLDAGPDILNDSRVSLDSDVPSDLDVDPCVVTTGNGNVHCNV